MNKPHLRTEFNGPTDELNYLSDMLRYCVLACPHDKATFLNRFILLLNLMGSDNHSLQLQEHWVFYYELVGDISNAINHQLRAVFYVRELLANGGAVGQVDYQYLVSSLEHLCRYYREMDDKVGAAGVAAEIVRIRKEYL